mgnify:CR=1 FL=1
MRGAVTDGFAVAAKTKEVFAVRTPFLDKAVLGHDDGADHAGSALALLAWGHEEGHREVVVWWSTRLISGNELLAEAVEL